MLFLFDQNEWHCIVLEDQAHLSRVDVELENMFELLWQQEETREPQGPRAASRHTPFVEHSATCQGM